MRSAQHNQRLSKRLGEEYEIIAALMLEDIIDKGLAETYEEAYEIMEGLTDYEVGEIAENFEFLAEEILSEQVEERDDLFDHILEYLVAEGYADTNEDALVIMANMSEEWRQEILDEAPKGLPFGPVGKGFRPIPAGRQREAMMKREKTLTKKAMSDRDNLYGGEATGDNRTKMGRISSTLTNPRLRP